jgi:hypothetical protein
MEMLARAHGISNSTPIAAIWKDSDSEEEFVERAKELDFERTAIEVEVPEDLVKKARERANLHARMADDLTDSDRVVLLLQEHDGELRLQEIVAKTDWTYGKTRGLLERMEKHGRVEILRLGENHVKLTDPEPRLGEDHDRRVHEDLLNHVHVHYEY